MSTLMLHPAVTLEPAASRREHGRGPGMTLEDLVAGTWEALVAGSPAGCPACATELWPRHSAAAAGVVGGRCGGCGATLA
jgi:hypothetical protein